MNYLKSDYIILGIEMKYIIRRVIFIGIPSMIIAWKVYNIVVRFLLALGLR